MQEFFIILGGIYLLGATIDFVMALTAKRRRLKQEKLENEEH
jgi:hypothetical protein